MGNAQSHLPSRTTHPNKPIQTHLNSLKKPSPAPKSPFSLPTPHSAPTKQSQTPPPLTPLFPPGRLSPRISVAQSPPICALFPLWVHVAAQPRPHDPGGVKSCASVAPSFSAHYSSPPFAPPPPKPSTPPSPPLISASPTSAWKCTAA